jgi:hypothetical protein
MLWGAEYTGVGLETDPTRGVRIDQEAYLVDFFAFCIFAELSAFLDDELLEPRWIDFTPSWSRMECQL